MRAHSLQTAQSLMERALKVLDDVGESAPAVHLQMALDILTGARFPRSIEDIEANPGPASHHRVKAHETVLTSDAEGSGRGPLERANAMISLHSDKALGRARMQLYEAISRRDLTEINQLSLICGILLELGYH